MMIVIVVIIMMMVIMIVIMMVVLCENLMAGILACPRSQLRRRLAFTG